MSGFGDADEVSFDDVAAATTFDTGEMEAALTESTKIRPEQKYIGAPQDKDEAESKARKHGYTAPVPYDYSAYGTRSQAATDGGEGEDIMAPITVGSGINTAQAARYEWKDEYGDVGPKIPELEEHLFTSEFRMEAGLGRSRIDAIMTEIKEHSSGDIVNRTIYKVSFFHPFSHCC